MAKLIVRYIEDNRKKRTIENVTNVDFKQEFTPGFITVTCGKESQYYLNQSTINDMDYIIGDDNG